MKKRTTSLFLAKLLAATPLAFTSQAPASAPPMKPVELASRGENGLSITVDSGSFDVVILPGPKLPSGCVGQQSAAQGRGVTEALSEMASDFFSEIHVNHRDAVVFWGSALLSLLAVLF